MLRRLVVLAAAAAAAALGVAALPAAGTGAFTARVQHAALRDGTSIAWYERGTGPPLLMNMGSESTMAEWDPALLRRLAAHHRLIMWDYRGMGLSRGRLRGLSIDRLADDAAEFLAAIGVPRADVLGWSLGGFVTQRLMVRHPGTVRAAVLAGTNPGGPATVFGPEWAQVVDDDPSRSDAAVIRVIYPGTRAGKASGAAFLRRLDTASESGEIPNDFDIPQTGFDAQVAAERRWIASPANLRQLRSLRTPVLVAGGTLDVLTPPANDAILARAIPGSTRIRFPRGGHAFLFQFAQPFSRQVTAFLTRAPAAAPIW